MTIAGSDPSGGAGIQVDLKTFSKLGCYGQAVITALTVQNTIGVRRSMPVNSDLVFEQIAMVMEDMRPDAVKIGMLPHAETVKSVTKAIREFQPTFVVLDPVMISSSGLQLMDDAAVAALREDLIPLCTLITPNLPEAKVLAGHDLHDGNALAQAIVKTYPNTAVLVKGGHRMGAPVDVLCSENELYVYDGVQRIETRNTHGTGCVLSSAIAAFVARGHQLPEAVGKAKTFLTEALQKGEEYEAGRGHGPLYLLP